MSIATRLRLGTLLPVLLTTGAVGVALLTADNSSAGIQGSGHRNLLAIGTVTETGNGSITVTGFSYSTAGADVRIDGHPGAPGQIQAGDVVSLVAASSADGSDYFATEVTFSGSVRGKVTGVDTQSGTFFVLGQVVRVDANTAFGPSLRSAHGRGVQVGDVVEVSAFANSSGELVASRVDSKGYSHDFRVVGSAHALNPVTHSFYVNALKVDYDSARVKGEPIEGAPVTVQGFEFAADGALIAKSVNVGAPPGGEPGATGRIQGIITSYSSDAYFEVNGRPVIVGAGTQLKLAVPIGLDVAVTVFGSFDTNGVLAADSVQTSR